jgi:hypothetical protein
MAANPPLLKLPISIREQYPDLYDWIRNASNTLNDLRNETGEDSVALNYDNTLFDTQVVPSGSKAVLFSFTKNGQSIDGLTVRVTNITGSAATIDIWCEADGGSQADADKVVSSKSVGANDYLDIAIPRMVGEGNQAQLSCEAGTGSALVIGHLSGVRRS